MKTGLADEWNPVYPFDIRNINWQWALAAIPVPHQTDAPKPDDVTLHVNFAVRSGALSATINLGYPSAMLKTFVFS